MEGNGYLVFLCLLAVAGTIQGVNAVRTPPPRKTFPSPAQLLYWTETVMNDSSLGRGKECLTNIQAWLPLNLPDVYPPSINGYLAYCRCWLKLCGILGYTLKDEEEDIVTDLDNEFVNMRFYQNLDRNIATIVGYSVAFLAGVVGNLSVIITVVFYMPKENITNIFITSLSTADLMVCVICIPCRVVRIVYGRWVLGKIVCYITAVWYFVGLAASALNLVVMGLERYLAIVFPMKAQAMNSAGRARKTVCLLWLIAVVMSIPSYRIVDTSNRSCAHRRFHRESEKYYIFLFVAVFLVPVLTLGYVYSHISYTLWKSIKSSAASTMSQDNDAKKRLKMIFMLIALVVVFVICWCPTLAWNVFYFDGVDGWLENADTTHNDVYPFIELLTYVNSCLNPLLYAFMSTDFRKGFKLCLRFKKPERLDSSVDSFGPFSTTVSAVPAMATSPT